MYERKLRARLRRRLFNTLLYTAERVLLREEGLPGRPWFRHQIYSPGRYTGYGAKTLPWIREAIEQRNYEKVRPA